MTGIKQISQNVNGKRKLTENGATADDNDMQTKKLTLASRSTSASFPLAAVSQPGIVIYDDNMKRSVSWPGPTSSKPRQSFEEVADLESYVDNILDTKFLQQTGLVLKHSVFRTEGAGVTKSLHNKACELIANAAFTYSVSSGTAMLGMQLFDRALSLTVVRKVEVSLLAATCLFLAAKLEEINFPYADELAYFCGKRFEKGDVHSMEQVLLPLFQCQIGIPTRYDFAQRFFEAGNLSTRERSLVSFLLELSYLDFDLNYFLPSKVAAGAIHLAIQMLRHSPNNSNPIWPAALQKVTRCQEQDLLEIVVRLRALHWNVDASPMRNILQRYTTEAHYGLAELSPLPYSQLRFDAHTLPRQERVLADYSTCKSIDERLESTAAPKIR